MAKKKRAMYVIFRGNPDVEGNILKINALNVVVKFIQKVLPKTTVISDKNTIIVIFPDTNAGDTKWVLDNVFRFVDIMGTTNDGEAEKKAEKAFDKYKSVQENGPERVGTGLLLYYMQHFYLMEKSASVFEVEL